MLPTVVGGLKVKANAPLAVDMAPATFTHVVLDLRCSATGLARLCPFDPDTRMESPR